MKVWLSPHSFKYASGLVCLKLLPKVVAKMAAEWRKDFRNIITAITLTVMLLFTDVHGPQRMIHYDFDDSLTLP